MGFSCEDRDDETLRFPRHDERRGSGADTGASRLPLFFAGRQGTWPLGRACVLLQLAENYFILTAAHVFDKRTIMPIPINVTDGVAGHTARDSDR